jgi:hypothetical protein
MAVIFLLGQRNVLKKYPDQKRDQPKSFGVKNKAWGQNARFWGELQPKNGSEIFFFKNRVRF